ncbi:MAG: hypothetical protein AAF764_07800 [Pseudomonadota bacterium]
MSKQIWLSGLALLAALVMVVFPVSALSTGPMNAAQIEATLFGKTFSGEYPSGTAWRETFEATGRSIYEEGGRTDVGTMTFEGSAICFKYNDPERTGGCFIVWRRGLNCFDFYSTNNASSRLDRDRGERWDARGWEEGVAKDCTAALIS